MPARGLEELEFVDESGISEVGRQAVSSHHQLGMAVPFLFKNVFLALAGTTSRQRTSKHLRVQPYPIGNRVSATVRTAHINGKIVCHHTFGHVRGVHFCYE